MLTEKEIKKELKITEKSCKELGELINENTNKWDEVQLENAHKQYSVFKAIILKLKWVLGIN